MKIFYLNLLILISFCSFAQNNKLKENGSFQKTIRFNNALTKEEAIRFFADKNGLDSHNKFDAKKQTSDESGLTHQRHQQYYKDIKVEFGTLITHSRNGIVESINAELYNANELNLTPSFDANEGLNRVLADINATKYLWEDDQQARIVGYQKPTGELVIFPIVKTGEVRLAYKFDVYAMEPLSRQEVFIDANNGQILYKNQVIKHATDFKMDSNDHKFKSVENFEALVTGTANTKYSGVRSIETRFDTPLNMYVLNDQTRGSQIVTYNCERLINVYQNVHFKDNDNNWTLAEHNNSFYDNAAQDAHWGAEMTYDFWKNIFNRNGFDDSNGTITSYVHYKQTAANFSNAFWNGAFMTYGDGNTRPWTSIDICGHEIGHAICTYTANLAYQNQSGAMNEGFSDIWGACIEHYGRTGSLAGTPVANIWRIAEDISVPSGIRNMSTPLSFGDPDTFQGTNWFVTADDGPCVPTAANDRCGVHTNSGVMNHWFYILTMGKAGTNNAPIADRDTYNVAGIGMVKSSQIAYYAERDYLTPNATYFDARDVTIAVANSLYCGSGPEVTSVTNAWFAVNVGPSFVSNANDVSLREIAETSSANCGVTSVPITIYFDNFGTNPITSVAISYNIDGGANTNTTWTGNLATCASGNFQITVNLTGLSVGKHSVNFTTSITNDGNVSNNSKSTYVFVNQSGGLNQINTFENPSDDLIAYDTVVSTTLWQRGTSNKPILTNAVAGNSKVYATNLNGQYPNATKSYLMSRCYDLSTTPNPLLKFDMAFDLEYNADIVYMQYTTNGGLNWNHLGSSTNTNWYNSNSNCENCFPGGEWSGSADNSTVSGSTNGTKQSYSYNLSAFGLNSASPQSNIVFRFVFHSNDTQNGYDGAIIDNFVIETTLGVDQNSLNNFSVYPNPTSGNITISFNSNSNENVNLSLYDVQGRLITSSKVDSVIGNFNHNFDLGSIPTGFYLLKISQGNQNYTSKIIKK